MTERTEKLEMDVDGQVFPFEATPEEADTIEKNLEELHLAGELLNTALNRRSN